MSVSLSSPFTLPCGAVLRNRLAKAPMTEGIADSMNRATPAHATLYRRWAQGGTGLLITGNVHVDRRFLERPGNVAIDNNGGLEELRAYAQAATENDTHCWMQINHPGRQAGVAVEQYVAPSRVRLVGKEGETRALTEDEILDIIRRFAHVARTARDCGFTGIQVHAAHGYLLSQFLNPLTNQRTDAWGGSLENRARALLEVYRATRAAVGADFPISVKLNSADFQKGGMTEEESTQVIRWLTDEKLDLLEVSGGNYESVVMIGHSDETPAKPKMASTLAREAYFIEFAANVRPQVRVPLMVTGGFRTRSGMQDALAADALDVIGLGRPLCIDTAYCAKLLDGSVDRLPSPDMSATLDRALMGDLSDKEHHAREVTAGTAYYFNQIRRLADGLEPESQIDWHEQLIRHESFDAARAGPYRATFTAAGA